MRTLLTLLSLACLTACGLFPALEELSACTDGGDGCAGQPVLGGQGGASGAGTGGQAGLAGAGAGGIAGAGASGGAGSAGAGAGAGGSSGTSGQSGAGGEAGAGASGSGGAGAGGEAGAAGVGVGGEAGAGAGGSMQGGEAGAGGEAGGAGEGGAAGGGEGPGGAGAGGSIQGGEAGVGGAGAGGSGGAGAGGSGGAGAGGAGDPCGGKEGPPGVAIQFNGAPLYCIDSLETTFADYQQFVDFTAGASPSQPSTCDWNTEFTWPNWVKSSPSTLPVGGIDWCDAWAYCAFRGKRLCGKVGGGALQLAGMSDPQVAKDGEFARACSANGTKKYPYGSEYVGDACNDSGGAVSNESVPVGSLVACEGGYPGLFDMSGNAQEWINACDAENADPKKTQCYVAGGTWNFPGNATYCTFSQPHRRDNSQTAQNGVRCCWDPE